MTCCSFTSWPCFSTRSAFSLSKSTGGSDSPGLLSRPCCPFRIYGYKEEKFIKELCIQCGRESNYWTSRCCKPTFNRNKFISQITIHKLVCADQFLQSTPVMLGHPLSKDWILPKDIHDEKSLANLVKMSLARIKVCSQNYIISI